MRGPHRTWDGDRLDSSKRPIHPVVLEYVFGHPALPFAFGGHGPSCASPAKKAYRSLVGPINDALVEDGVAVLSCRDGRLELRTLSPPGYFFVGWSQVFSNLSERLDWLMFDLKDVPGAFSSTTALSLEQVQAGARLRRSR